MVVYIFNTPELSDKTRADFNHMKMDLAASFNFSWTVVHNSLLMRHSIALDNLTNLIPLIDEDQKLDLLHAPMHPLKEQHYLEEVTESEHGVCWCPFNCLLLQQNPL